MRGQVLCGEKRDRRKLGTTDHVGKKEGKCEGLTTVHFAGLAVIPTT